MKTSAKFKEYIWLVNTIRKAGRISFAELQKKWTDTEMSEGVELARATFNRHKDAIEDIFGIYIECDRQDGYRYYIGNEGVLAEESVQNWMLSTLSVSNQVSESLSLQDRILLESIPSESTRLEQIIEGMKKRVCLSMEYQKYGHAEPKTVTLEPYCIKLFKRRWYAVVKFAEPDGLFFTLAFDRIVYLEVSEDKFVYDKNFDPAGWFKDSYGIVRDGDVPVEKVVIRAFGKEANYLRDLPFHHSQKEICREEDFSDFELLLSPTSDFWTPLLSRGSAIKVLQPHWLAEEIRRIHREAAKLYE